jgi:hypothetical protein
MRGNHLASPPQPRFSEREKRLLSLLWEDGALATLSYQDIALMLNRIYPNDNGKCRTRKGVEKFIRKKKEELCLKTNS